MSLSSVYPLGTTHWMGWCVLVVPFAAVSLAGALTSDASGCLPVTVHNAAPQEVQHPIDERWRIYYPLLAHRGAGEAPGAMDAAQQLLREFFDLHTAMQYERAAAVAQELAEMLPDRPQAHYNVACALARLHRADEALAALELAIDCGWRDLVHLSIDPDLDTVRTTIRYGELVKKVEHFNAKPHTITSPLRTDRWPRVIADLRRQTPRLLHRHRVPGASIALIHDDRVVWSAAFGWRDLKGRSPLAEDALFQVAASRRLFGLAAALQQRPSILRLADAADNQPSLPIPDADQPMVMRIDDWTSRPPVGLLVRSTGGQRSDGLEIWREVLSATTAPNLGSSGSRGPSLLIRAVESVTGQPFATYCQEHILDPLNLSDTRFDLPSGLSRRVALGHDRRGTPIEPEPCPEGAVVVYSTAHDLALLYLALLQPQSHGPLWLAGETSADQLLTIGSRFGLDTTIDQAADAARVQFVSQGGGGAMLLRWYPDVRRGIVVLTNSEVGHDAAERIAQLALGGG